MTFEEWKVALDRWFSESGHPHRVQDLDQGELEAAYSGRTPSQAGLYFVRTPLGNLPRPRSTQGGGLDSRAPQLLRILASVLFVTAPIMVLVQSWNLIRFILETRKLTEDLRDNLGFSLIQSAGTLAMIVTQATVAYGLALLFRIWANRIEREG